MQYRGQPECDRCHGEGWIFDAYERRQVTCLDCLTRYEVAEQARREREQE